MPSLRKKLWNIVATVLESPKTRFVRGTHALVTKEKCLVKIFRFYA
jgi:hypothetical protein